MKEFTSYNFTEVLQSREAYRALGEDLNSWTQGGCWVLAQALRVWVGPRAALYCVRGEVPLQYKGREPIVYGPLVVHHVLARIGGFYLDADGIDEGQKRVLGTWTHIEHLRNTSLETFLPRYRKAALKEGVVCPPAAVKRVTALLEKHFGPGEEAVAWMDGEEVRPNPAGPLVLYHGSQRWEGGPRIVPHKKGHAEAGAGIYMTTSFETAKSYAKGGGSVVRFELDPNLRWLEDARVSVDDVSRFIATRGILSRSVREKIGSDLLSARTRSRDPKTIPANTILNLMVNYEAVSGAAGPALAAFLVDQGIDASHDRHSSREDWVVLFNPAKIRTWKVVKSADVQVSDYDLPRIVRSNPLIPWWT